jgi:hypothetical protein
MFVTINDLMIKLRSFKISTNIEKKTNYLIMSPTSLCLTGFIDANERLDITDKKHQSFTIDFQEISLNMCPQMLNTSLKMLSSIQHSLNQRFSDDETNEKELSNEKKEMITNTSDLSLFSPVFFNVQDFWFTQPKYDTISQSSSLSDFSSISSGSRRDSELHKYLKTEAFILFFNIFFLK